MPAIFISHSSKDRTVSGDVRAALDRLGFQQTFLDFDKETGLGAGDNWERRLYEELTRCHAVVLLLTPAWLGSKWCFAEMTQARALGKVILPVMCAPLGGQFVLPDIQAVDLVDWNAGGLERLEKRLRAISDELARGFTLDPTRPPYPGIHAFEEADAAIYFGRDEESRAVLERLDARRTQGGARFVVIIGASGSGKSSLLKASVLPLLKRRRAQWVVLPDIRPEKAPMEALAKGFAEFSGKPEAWRAWHDKLTGPDAVSAIERFVQDTRIGDAKSATVLLPIDQFEEVFTTTPAAERAAFLGLLQATFTRGLPFVVVATGRSDVLEGLIESSELVGHYETFPLTAMPLERYPRLIEGPAAVAGINIEKGLSERIGRDVESREALPLLAHMLALLYQRGGEDKKLSLAEYELLGDPAQGLNPIQNSIRLAADEAIARVKPDERELSALRDAFVPHLVRVRLDDGKRVRQTARRTELPQDALRLISALTEARLLTTRGDSEQRAPLVEVTHESLFKSWPTLDRWLTEEQAFLTDLERIRSAHENWSKAPEDQRTGELLYGLLLSRARDWLLKYPQRFISREMEPLRAFIAASAQFADAEKAREAERDERERRMQKQRTRIAVAAAVAGFILAGGAGLSYHQANQERARAEELRTRAEQATESAVAQRNQAEAQRKQAQVTQSQFLADLARQHYENQDYGTALALALEALPVQRRNGIRPYVPVAESMLYQAVTALRELPSPDAPGLVSAAFSPDGTRLVTTSNKGLAHIWNTTDPRDPIELKGHEGLVNTAAFSPDGKFVVTGGEDRTARLWDAVNGNEIAILSGQPSGVQSVSFSRDGSRIALATGNVAQIWDGRKGGSVVTLKGHGKGVRSVVFAPDGARALTASEDGTARIWNLAQEPEVVASLEHRGAVHAATYSPDGTLILTASEDNSTGVWAAADGARVILLDHDGPVNNARFSADGQRFIIALGNEAHVWSTPTKLAHAVRGLKITHDGRVFDATFSPDGALILTSSEDASARLWDAATGKPIGKLLPQDGPVWTGAFAPDGRQMTVSNTVRLWRSATEPHVTILHPGLGVRSVQLVTEGQQVLALGHNDTLALLDVTKGTAVPDRTIEDVSSIAVTGDGSRVVAGLADGTAQVRDVATGRPLRSIGSKEMPARNPVISADGRWVVAASAQRSVRVWDAESGSEILVLPSHRNAIVAIAVSPDRKRIATAMHDRQIQVFDAAGNRISEFRQHTGDIQTLAFSPDGEKIVSASADRTARIWNAATGEPIHVLRTPDGTVHSAAFSPDGTTVLTASNDNTARIWDVTLGIEVGLLQRHPNPIDFSSAAYAPDGRSIVTASSDGIRIWPAFPTTKDLMDHAGKILPRRLSQEQRTRFYLNRQDSEQPRSPREP
jgi:WD40 repeat protein